MYLLDRIKEDKFLGGPFGISSKSLSIRSPFHIESLKRQGKVESILEKAREFGTLKDFEQTK